MLDYAIQEAKQFSSSEEGLYQAIDAVGGAPMINKISGILDRNPVVKIAVNGILSNNGLNFNKIKDRFQYPQYEQSRSVHNDNRSKSYQQENNPVNSYRDKLDKMK